MDAGGAYLLPRLVGMQRAKELMFLGERLSAADARDLELVNRVVAAPDLDRIASELLAKLAAMPTGALSLTKRLVKRPSTMIVRLLSSWRPASKNCSRTPTTPRKGSPRSSSVVHPSSRTLEAKDLRGRNSCRCALPDRNRSFAWAAPYRGRVVDRCSGRISEPTLSNCVKCFSSFDT